MTDQTKISVPALKAKLEAMSMAKLTMALADVSVDAQIKKYVERELDDRANRGTSRGFGERVAA